MEDKIREHLQAAAKIVDASGVNEALKPVAFKLAFSILWTGKLELTDPHTAKQHTPAHRSNADNDTLSKVADFTGASLEQLNEIFFKDEDGSLKLRNIPLDLLGKTRRERQRGLASVFLLAKKLQGKERVSGTEVAKLMKDRGILDGNLNMIARGSDRVATADGKGKGLHYQLSSSGEKEAIKVINKVVPTE